MIKPLIKHQGLVVPFNRSDIDTDALLPKQYLKMIEKVGFGDFLFDDERYLTSGDVDVPVSERKLNPNCILNQPPYNHGSIFLAQKNFGCGSSREHAVWALRDFGVRVVIAPSFGDIFYNNCFNNGVLPIVLSQADVDELFALEEASKDGLELTVNVAEKTLSGASKEWHFELSEGRQHGLINGLDQIGKTLEYAQQIRDYETTRRKQQPWLFIDNGIS